MWGKQWSHKRPSPILTIFIGGMKNTLITFSWLPSGKFSHNYGKSPLTMENHHFFVGESTISMDTYNSFWYVYQAGYINHLTSKKGHRGLHISAEEINGSHHRDIRAAGSADLGAGARGRQGRGGWEWAEISEFSG